MSDAASSVSGMPDTLLAAVLFAIDPVGTCGVALRSRWGPARDRWLACVQDMLPDDTVVRRIPPNVTDDRLLGGLDLAATLQTKRVVFQRGVLAEADGGIVLVSMAERLAASTVSHLTAVLDLAQVVVERDGIAARLPAAVGLIALDEGVGEDEGLPGALLDRLAFRVELPDSVQGDGPDRGPGRGDIERARNCLRDVSCSGEITAALCEAAMALGIESVRAPLLAQRVARANAALHGRRYVADVDAAVAGRFVLLPRAIRLPASGSPPQEADTVPDDAGEEPADDDGSREAPSDTDQPLADVVLSAVRAAMPVQILGRLQAPFTGSARASASGKAGAITYSPLRGRPVGVRRGDPRGRSRINVIATLRAAAPWQGLRKATTGRAPLAEPRQERVEIRREDFRITRFKRSARTTTIFVVDASGSSAANRLAEAKGAVELLLADCYVRRDEVALIAFRGSGAEFVLPPTRSLVRAKRCLAGLPGGGATPLAAAIDMAMAVAHATVRKGQSPVVVLLTDGRANVTRAGTPGVAQAEREAIVAARALRVAGVRALVVDTSPRPRPQAERLAADMGALYLPLPYAGSKALSDAIQASTAKA